MTAYDGLSDRHKVFVDEYLKDLNASAAYKRAYQRDGKTITDGSARTAGGRLLTKVDIAAAIQERANERTEKAGITIDYILNGVKRVIERCEQAEPVLDHDGNETGEYKFEANAALKGYELLGRYKGAWDGEGGGSNRPVIHNHINLAGRNGGRKLIQNPVRRGTDGSVAPRFKPTSHE